MRNKLFIFGKIATLAIAIATTLVACKDKGASKPSYASYPT